MKPIWLLDFDGVLNAFDETRPVLGDWDDWETSVANGFPIRYSPAMIARILALHEAGAVEVQWLTTWGRQANTDLPQLDLPEFVVAGEQPYREGLGWWKLPVAQVLFEAGHPIVWTDDDIVYSYAAGRWLNEVAAGDRAADLFAFAPKGAISRQEMADIEAWLTGGEGGVT